MGLPVFCPAWAPVAVGELVDTASATEGASVDGAIKGPDTVGVLVDDDATVGVVILAVPDMVGRFVETVVGEVSDGVEAGFEDASSTVVGLGDTVGDTAIVGYAVTVGHGDSVGHRVCVGKGEDVGSQVAVGTNVSCVVGKDGDGVPSVSLTVVGWKVLVG